MLNWRAFVGPKGLPADIVKMLNAAGNKAWDKDLRQKMLDQGGNCRRHAGAVRGADQGRNAEVGQGRQGRQDRAGMIPATAVCCIASNGG